MSKASEWAALDALMRFKINERNEARAGGAGLVLTHYGSDGNIMEQIGYTPDEALALAEWITDTLGEAP